MSPIPLKFDGPQDGPRIVLAHGAGAGMDHPFMETVAQGLAAEGLRVARFEFPYMQARRDTGTKKPPDREPVLRDTWLKVIEQLGPAEDLVIGGKSMGGRIASMVADEAGVKGLVCLGYPFHAPGRTAGPKRLAHLAALETPTLVLQGERDSMGNREEVEGYRPALSRAITVEWLPDGDHSLKPRKRSGHTEDENLEAAVRETAAFVKRL